MGARRTARRRSPTSTRCGPRSARARPSWSGSRRPTNPLLNIGDIEALAAVAHDAGALLVVDNTFASPYLQQPLALGADVVVHSTTKYCGGHSDVVGGALVVRDLELAETDRLPPERHGRGGRARSTRWLTLRGLKTLGVRMDRHCDNAEKVVEFLTGHPAVAEVIYPGLAGAPRPRGRGPADEAVRRHRVASGVAGGEQQALDVCDRAEVFTLGESLGGVESLIEHPGRMTHASVAGTDLEVPGRPDPAQRRHRDRRRPDRRPRPCPRLTERRPATVVCVDFGSTFTKALARRPGRRPDRRVRRAPDHDRHRRARRVRRLPGRARGAGRPGGRRADVLACSSAGGGLRIAVVGNEELVTAEAGRRVALSSGGKVVAVLAAAASDDLADARRQRARRRAAHRRHRRRQRRGAPGRRPRARRGRLARSGRGRRQRRGPREVAEILAAGGTPYVLADNVVPRIGVLAPGGCPGRDPRAVPRPRDRRQAPQRAAPTSWPWCRAPPPTSCSPASSCWRGLASVRAGDVVVVDVGGATTDVHWSSSRPGGRRAGPRGRRHDPVTRTVEGDLGMRWSARHHRRRRRGPRRPRRRPRAAAATTPASCPTTTPRPTSTRRSPRAAVGLALRRHAGRSKVVVSPEGRVVERTGKDLREVDLLVGSGGVLRHGRPGVAERVFAGSVGADVEGGWQLPAGARGSSSTPTTCWPPPGCSPTEHPEAAYALARPACRARAVARPERRPESNDAATTPPTHAGARRGARRPTLSRCLAHQWASPAERERRTGAGDRRPARRTSRARRCRGASTWRPPGPGGSS